MTRLQFHPVWEDKLTQKQKEELFTFFEELAPITGEFGAVLVRGKYKKNGGAVATVLLRNGYEKPLEIKQAKVEIMDSANHLVVAEEFALDLFLEEDSALPWSFVFSRESVKKADVDSANWKIHVDLQEKTQSRVGGGLSPSDPSSNRTCGFPASGFHSVSSPFPGVSLLLLFHS